MRITKRNTLTTLIALGLLTLSGCQGGSGSGSSSPDSEDQAPFAELDGGDIQSLSRTFQSSFALLGLALSQPPGVGAQSGDSCGEFESETDGDDYTQMITLSDCQLAMPNGEEIALSGMIDLHGSLSPDPAEIEELIEGCEAFIPGLREDLLSGGDTFQAASLNYAYDTRSLDVGEEVKVDDGRASLALFEAATLVSNRQNLTLTLPGDRTFNSESTFQILVTDGHEYPMGLHTLRLQEGNEFRTVTIESDGTRYGVVTVEETGRTGWIDWGTGEADFDLE